MQIVLKNRKLKVEIGAPMELYRGSRFDLSGNIFQLTLNNKHTFCTNEKNSHNNLFGFGLLNEFDIDEPFSHASAKNGEQFHKIGVGSLLRENLQEYDFSFNYKKTPLVYCIENMQPDQVVFTAKSPEIRGMKYSYTKRLSISGDSLSVDYELENCGSISFNTTEYCHNFLSINREPVNSSYILEIGAGIMPEHFTEVVNTHKLVFSGNKQLTFDSQPDSDFFISGLANSNSNCSSWILKNTKHKLAVREETSFICTKMNLWGNAHVISPELFHSVSLMPGKTAHWKRVCTFFEL